MARRTRNPIGSDSDSEAQTQQGGRHSQAQHDHGVIMDDLVDPDKTLRHLFLQAFISRRVVEVGLAQRLYKECAKMCALPHDNFAGFISTLEDGLTLLGLDIKRIRDQESGLSYIVLINTAEDAASKMATDFKPEEIAFFRAIVGEIMSTDDLSYSVTMKEALRCMKGSRMIAQELVRSFIAKGWLHLHRSQRLTLSVRSIAELGGWLRDTFDEDELAVVDCNACNAIVTCNKVFVGYACPNDDCPIRLHSYCVEARVNQGRCPGSLAGTCQETWIPTANGKYVGTIIGIKAIAGMEGDDEFEDEVGAGASSTPLGPTSTAASRATNGRSGGPKKRSGEARGARGGRVAVSDEEDEEDELMED
ncbi:BZ3500_MvSof-1268-A1-R1_Chr6-2g08469 [Microbotryum saponariae]|uniref:Non-structural maintenance of chromosomes element 1 homolog n=1 Tax=Microbotryum saponariae TaxID=289078 RepID=A0A2X0LBB8_9BASI|nr:BZ3500_MvSof-1268-A1-R1_Chr6-2g08469 [Microbotryum saponariae]SDA07746.1 BZ3501_MvSof-1269-A2-R1_Chr6-1g08183 [Microbotryum saponariae]